VNASTIAREEPLMSPLPFARLLLPALALVLMGAAGSILPDTDSGRRARAYFDAFNTGQEDAMRAFLVANVAPAALKERPIEVRLDGYRRMREGHGTLTPSRVLEQSDEQIHVMARDRFDHDLDLTFQFDAEAPHLMLGVRVLDSGPGGGGPPPDNEPVTPLSEDQAAAAWRARLDSLARGDRFSGAALFAKDDRVLFQSAYGEASRPKHVPNRVDTKFNLGSINKVFTKLAIAQLVEQGQVRLDDTIDHYLRDYPKAVASRVTVGQLLEHRGGIGDVFGDAYDRMDRSKLRTVNDWIPLFRDVPLAFEPGTQERYSNGGYVLLGAIVERVSGEDYFDYMRRHVYGPLGMKDTDHFASDGRTSNLANGYTRDVAGGHPTTTGAWSDNASTRPWRGSPAGGGYSTLADLLRFVTAMRGGKLLKPGTLARDFPEWQPGPHGELGLGVGGGAPGINAAVETVGPYTVIVLANLDPPAAEEPARWLARRLPGGGAGRVRRVGSGGGPEGGGPEGAHVMIDAPPHVTLPATGVTVEMLKADHLPAVRVMVNGQGPFLFGIDTGARGAARVDSAVAAKLGLEVVGQVRAGDPSGRNSRMMNLVRVGALEIGGARFEGVQAAVRDYNERRIGSTPIDGILGFGLFQELLLTLDYPGAKVKIERGALPPVDGTEVIPIRVDRGIPSIDLVVDTLKVDADVDAGSMGGFSLPEDLIGRLPLAGPPQVVGHARTVSNEFDIKAARLQGSLRIGRREFTNPMLEFQPVFAMGNVGSRVLRDFAVTFDSQNRRMRWKKAG
jgi:CubicO group peptidase (beta-lactamase class C family)